MSEEILKKIDNNNDNLIEVQELRKALDTKFFDDVSNITSISEYLKSSEKSELLSSLEDCINTAIDNILLQTEISDNDIQILDLWNKLFGENNGEKKEKIQQKILEKLDINSLNKTIDSELSNILQNYSNNLQQLGVDIKSVPDWKDIIRDIKTIEDINKINDKNIIQYIAISQDVPKENYPYIVSNFQQILAYHLIYNPGFKTMFGTGGFATGMNIENIQKNNEYVSNVVVYVDNISKDKNFKNQIKQALNTKNNQIFDLWLKKTINGLDGEKLTQKIGNIFDEIFPGSDNMKSFYDFGEKNNFIKSLVNGYIMYRASKEGNIKTDGKSYVLLDWKNNSYLTQNFYKKGSESFDQIYEQTKSFYDGMAQLGINSSIPIEKILEFNIIMDSKGKNISSLNKKRDVALAQVIKDSHGSMGAISGGDAGIAGFVSNFEYNKSIYDKEIQNETLGLEIAYARLLLLSDPKPKGKIQGISGQGIMLDFSKGNDPDKIVRDSFSEQLGDQRDKFKYDMKNDRQAAFGSFCGMIGGIGGSAIAGILSKNIFATSVGFTLGLRIGNGIGQEVFNAGEFIYEKTTGSAINDGNNKVDRFGDSFLRGAGITDQNNKYIGTEKLLVGLGFDYLTTAATFGLSNKFSPLLTKLGSTRVIGGGLKFGMEELVIENFLVDMPMNVVQTGVETYIGISDGSITGQTALGNEKATPGERKYAPGSLSEAILAMQDAAQKNISFENLSQTFFSTVIYGGLLEGGGAGISKVKGYLPSTHVDNFESTAKIAGASIAGLTTFMTQNNISFEKNGVCIDTKTGQALLETDTRIESLKQHLTNVEIAKQANLNAFTNLLDAQQQIVNNPNSATGMLFRLGLISSSNTPINIINNKLAIIEKKLQEAQQKGDQKQLDQLNYLKSEYEKAKNAILTTESISSQIEQDQNVFDDTNIDQNLDTNTESDLNILDKVKLRIGEILLSFHGKTELEIISDAGKYVVDNVKHFLHECKMVFGPQLIDTYKSYIQMKNHIGKPGDIEFQKLFQDKLKSWGVNLTKLVGTTAVSKLGIDPNLFFWSGHLIADQLKKNITFFDKLFNLSFETMNDLYGRKEGKNIKYNPQTVVENSLLTVQDRKEAIAKHLGLEINPQNEQLLNSLLDAHKIGQSEIGKNPEYSAGVYNYTQAQIRQKMEILKPFIENGSITSEQVRELFALGYLGSESIKVGTELVSNSLETTIKSTVDPETVKINAALEDGPRLQEAEKLLGQEFAGKLIRPDGTTTELGQKILEAHNQDGTIYNLNYTQLRARVEILSKAGFTSEQVRVLIKTGICGQAAVGELDVIIKNNFKDELSLAIEKKDTENLLPNEFFDYMIETQTRLLEAKIKRNPDIKITDNVSFQENITLVNHNDLGLVNPQKQIIKIEIDTTLDKFLDTYKKSLETQMDQLLKKSDGLSNEKAYSIYDFNQDIFFQATGEKEAKNESGYINYISNGKIIYSERLNTENIQTDNNEEIHSLLVENTYNETILRLQSNIDANIDVEKNRYLLKCMDNLAKTSRTAQGILDASASANKQFKFEKISPEEAGVKAIENFKKASEFLYENRFKQFNSTAELQSFIEQLAKDINAGILKPEYFMRDENPDLGEDGKPKYAYTEVTDVNIAFKDFCESFLKKLNDPAIDPVELAARVEYRVNLKDHFFADGCGKISVALSNFVLMRYGKELPDIREGKERFKYSGKEQRNAKDPSHEPDLKNWTEYYKTLYIMKNIENKSEIEIDLYIKKYNDEGGGVKGRNLIISEKDNKIIFINEKGILRRIDLDNSKDLKNNTNILYKNPDFSKMNANEIHEYAIEHRNEIIKQYRIDNPNDKFLIDVDNFRQYLGGKQGVSAQNTHEGASFIADSYFDWLIENNKKGEIDGFNLTIRFLAGGPGSGKSLASQIESNDGFNAILDGTFKTYKNAEKNIKKALDNGFDVKVDFVGRNFDEAWNEGVVKRTVEQNILSGIQEKMPGTDIKSLKINSLQALLDGDYNKAFDGKYKEIFGENYENLKDYINYTGRTVPIGVFYEGHDGARNTLIKLYEKYPDKLRFSINGEKNIGRDAFKDFTKNDRFDINKAGSTLSQAYNSKFISQEQWTDLFIGYEKTKTSIENIKKE